MPLKKWRKKKKTKTSSNYLKSVPTGAFLFIKGAHTLLVNFCVIFFMKRLSLILFIVFIGCYNNPTPPSEITGAQISGLQYERFDCETLNDEIIFLENRERELILAQENRIKESNRQQSWANGMGKGDGIEASELHRVKGEKLAALIVFQSKECNVTK